MTPMAASSPALMSATGLPGFTGAIGEFLLAAPKLSGTEVEVGEPITLAIALTGEGNLVGVSAPDAPAENPDWQMFKPTTDLNSPNDETAPLLATKTFTYTLIPKRANVRATPALPFSYFDPAKAKFVDISVPPMPVKVKAGPEAPQSLQIWLALLIALLFLIERWFANASRRWNAT